MLFLIYTTTFCWVCFAVSATWVWSEILSDGQYTETLMPINYVMLAVISGIIGVVLAGFTGWHIMLASKGQTTIECLEKTRYLSPLRKSMQHQHIAQHQGNVNGTPGYGQQLLDVHTNALPGVMRPEEGETFIRDDIENGRPMPQTYDARERSRARARYEEYLDEKDSEQLPSAFDHGWRKNLGHLFGPKPLLWFFPVVTTTGDGWSWEPSPKWVAARDRLREERERQMERERVAGWGGPSYQDDRSFAPPPQEGAGRHYLTSPVPSVGRRSPSKADRVLGRDPSQYADEPETHQGSMPMQNLRPSHNDDDDDDDYEESSDEQEALQRKQNLVPTPGWSVKKIAGRRAGSLLGGRILRKTNGLAGMEGLMMVLIEYMRV